MQSALSLFQGIIGNITGTASGAAGEVGGRAGGTAGEVTGHAGTEGEASAGEAHGTATSASTATKGHLDQFHQETHRDVGQAIGQAQQAPQAASGEMPGLVQRVLAGAPALLTLMSPFVGIFTRLFGDLPGKIMRGLATAERLANTVIDRVEQTVLRLQQRIVGTIDNIAGKLTSAMDWVVNRLAALTRTAHGLIDSLPSWARPPIAAVIERVLVAVTRAAAALAARARAFIQNIVERATAWLRRLSDWLTGLLERLRAEVTRAFAWVRQKVNAAVAALARVRDWLIAKVRALIARAIKAVLGPIYQRVYNNLMQMIGPAVQGAIAQARLAFPNGMPTPPEVVAAATQAAQQAGPSIMAQIRQGILNPEGDHFSIGFQLGGAIGGGVGVSGGGGASLEIVLDYRRNDIGFFVSPAAGGQVNVGDIGETGNLSGVGAWGTVGSFGEPDQDVLQSWSGWFTNVTYGAQAGLAVEGGLAVSTGGSFYRSGSVELSPPIASYTPLGAGTHTEPGGQLPDRNVPATPGTPRTVDLGEVRFRSQEDNPDAQAGGAAAMDHAADVVRTAPTSPPGTGVNDVHVVGEASRRWRAPHTGSTPESENATLAQSRATHVKEGLQRRLGGAPPVEGHGAGDRRAAADGMPPTDGSPQYQRAVMFADVTSPGTPEHTEPGGQAPDRQVPNKMEIKAGLPNPFTSQRTAWGWDTTVGVSGLVGAAGKAGVYGGAGVSYSFPIGKTHLLHDTMEAIRINFGITKILLDIMSISPLGLLRDAIALFRVHAAPDAQAQITQAATSYSIPAPPGTGVA